MCAEKLVKDHGEDWARRPAPRLMVMPDRIRVRKAAQRGTLPCVRLGRNLRFRRDELLASVRR
jgi:hypothetical protein